MRDKRKQIGHRAVLVPAVAAVVLLLLASCVGMPRGTSGGVDLGAFRKKARAAHCADLRNQLVVVDEKLVFWDRAGSCSDAAYAQVLYGSRPDQVLCTLHDSIAGPVQECPDESYRDTFETIRAHLDSPDLGLGPGHTVKLIEP